MIVMIQNILLWLVDISNTLVKDKAKKMSYEHRKGGNF